MTQVDVRQRILADNAAAAAALRARFADSRTLVMNLISSPGSGKTTLLEATVRALAGEAAPRRHRGRHRHRARRRPPARGWASRRTRS